MKRTLTTLCMSLLVISLVAADDKTKPSDTKGKTVEDSPIVKKTREVKLITPISVEFKDEPLKNCLLEFKKQVEGLSMQLEVGVSGNQAFTYSAKEKALKDVLDEMFKGRGLGFVIHRKEKEGDRYEGWVMITQGDERGDAIVKGQPAKPEPGKRPATTTKPEPTKPKPTEPANDADAAEKQAALKLKQAKLFLEDGKTDDAKDYFEQILKRWPKSKSAEEAKTLLEKMKK